LQGWAHLQTAGHVNQGLAGIAYREEQARLIGEGDFAGALQMDIHDIRSLFGSKYDIHLEQMLDYYITRPQWKLKLQ